MYSLSVFIRGFIISNAWPAWSVVTNLPGVGLVERDDTLVIVPPLKLGVFVPSIDVPDFAVGSFAILLQVASYMFHTVVPGTRARESLVAKETLGLCWGFSKYREAARLMFGDVVFCDRVLLLAAVRLGRRSCMHAPKVLPEKVFAVEVIVVHRLTIVRIHSRRAKVAAPEALLNMLCTDVSLPFILR